MDRKLLYFCIPYKTQLWTFLNAYVLPKNLFPNWPDKCMDILRIPSWTDHSVPA